MSDTTGLVRVGTSGWHYDDWAGIVYPDGTPKSRWFDHYASRFDTVELNAPFYRLPSETTVRRWAEAAPKGFRYAVKGSRFTTHNLKIGGQRLPDSVALIGGRLRPLGERMIAMLWQLPPNLHRDDERLDRFCGLLPGWTRHAVEFRHPSWHAAAVDEVLAAHDVARVWVSATGDEQPVSRTTDVVYLRLHGLGARPYDHDYTDVELAPWVERITVAVDEGATALVYFNNDVGGHAVANAVRFRELLTAAAGGRPRRTETPS